MAVLSAIRLEVVNAFADQGLGGGDVISAMTDHTPTILHLGISCCVDRVIRCAASQGVSLLDRHRVESANTPTSLASARLPARQCSSLTKKDSVDIVTLRALMVAAAQARQNALRVLDFEMDQVGCA